MTHSLCGMLGIIMIISGICSISIQTQVGEYTQYKVTISDEVNFTEFNDKYEIIEQDGKIYTIKERINE